VSSFPKWAVGVLAGSAALFPVLVVALWRWTVLGFWEAAYLVLLVELLPALALVQLPLAQADDPVPRVPVYVSSGAVVLVLGLGGILAGWGRLGPEAMGLVRVPWSLVVPWALGLSAGALLVMGYFFVLRRAVGLRESPLLIQLLPRTGKEKLVFAWLSLAAGVGEELAYRGFLVPVLALLLGSPWGAAVASSVVFGALHAYQGWLGMVRTGVLGLLLAASLILSGSLWPAILAHAILDLLAGLVIGETLVRE
jgi:membrane protease YdiL (CAAX protease family)